MTAKNYLMQVRYLDTRIQSKRDQVKRLRAMMAQGSHRVSHMPKGTKTVNWTDTAASIMDAERTIMHDIERCVNIRLAIAKAIDEMEDASLKCLLECRYLSGWSWNRIARHMNYSIDWIWHLHNKALKAFVVPNE